MAMKGMQVSCLVQYLQVRKFQSSRILLKIRNWFKYKIHNSQMPSPSIGSSKIRKIDKYMVPVPIGNELDKKTNEEITLKVSHLQ